MSVSQPPPAVLVTGGAQRIGGAIAERFAAAGWHVVIHYRQSAAEAEALAASLPSAETIGFDLADTAALTRAVDELAGCLPEWRALVCSASGFVPDSPQAPDPAVWDEMLDANLRGNVLLAARFLDKARASAGRRVVNLLDQKLANLNPDFFSYTLAKAGLKTAGEMLAMARADSADRIYGLAPGPAMASFDQTSAEFTESGRMNLLNRYTTPAEIADAAFMLVTGPFATGTTLFVDSGQHLVHQPRDVMFAIREGNS